MNDQLNNINQDFMIAEKQREKANRATAAERQAELFDRPEELMAERMKEDYVVDRMREQTPISYKANTTSFQKKQHLNNVHQTITSVMNERTYDFVELALKNMEGTRVTKDEEGRVTNKLKNDDRQVSLKLHHSRGTRLQMAGHNVLEINIGGTGFEMPRKESAGLKTKDLGKFSLVREQTDENGSVTTKKVDPADFLNKVYGKEVEEGGKKKEGIRKKESVAKVGEQDVTKVQYNMAGAGLMNSNTFDRHSMEATREYVLKYGSEYLQPVFEGWKSSGYIPDERTKKIHCMIKGHSRGACSASSGAMSVKQWLLDNYPEFEPYVVFDLDLYDPVPGTFLKVIGDDNGYDKVTELKGERKGLEAKHGSTKLAQLGSSVNATVHYCLAPTSETAGAEFNPQMVHGANRIIIDPTENHDVGMKHLDLSQAKISKPNDAMRMAAKKATQIRAREEKEFVKSNIDDFVGGPGLGDIMTADTDFVDKNRFRYKAPKTVKSKGKNVNLNANTELWDREVNKGETHRVDRITEGKAHQKAYFAKGKDGKAEVFRSSGLSDLDDGVYIADETGTLIKMENAEDAVKILFRIATDDKLKTKNLERFRRISEVVIRWFADRSSKDREKIRRRIDELSFALEKQAREGVDYGDDDDDEIEDQKEIERRKKARIEARKNDLFRKELLGAMKSATKMRLEQNKKTREDNDNNKLVSYVNYQQNFDVGMGGAFWTVAEKFFGMGGGERSDEYEAVKKALNELQYFEKMLLESRDRLGKNGRMNKTDEQTLEQLKQNLRKAGLAYTNRFFAGWKKRGRERMDMVKTLLCILGTPGYTEYRSKYSVDLQKLHRKSVLDEAHARVFQGERPVHTELRGEKDDAVERNQRRVEFARTGRYSVDPDQYARIKGSGWHIDAKQFNQLRGSRMLHTGDDGILGLEQFFGTDEAYDWNDVDVMYRAQANEFYRYMFRSSERLDENTNDHEDLKMCNMFLTNVFKYMKTIMKGKPIIPSREDYYEAFAKAISAEPFMVECMKGQIEHAFLRDRKDEFDRKKITYGVARELYELFESNFGKQHVLANLLGIGSSKFRGLSEIDVKSGERPEYSDEAKQVYNRIWYEIKEGRTVKANLAEDVFSETETAVETEITGVHKHGGIYMLTYADVESLKADEPEFGVGADGPVVMGVKKITHENGRLVNNGVKVNPVEHDMELNDFLRRLRVLRFQKA